MRKSPDDRTWLLDLILDGLQALPKSKEEYFVQTRGEIEQLVRFFSNLHRNELKSDVRSMKRVVVSDDNVATRNSKFPRELHSALSTAVVVFGKGNGALKGRDLWKPPAHAE
jgi:hypothetical protein